MPFLLLRAARRWGWPAAAAVLVGAACASRMVEADVLWQARTGELIVAHHRLPGTDPFSWTLGGQPWHPNSWGFDVLLGLAWRAGQLAGLAVVIAGLAAALALVMTARAFGRGGRPGTAAAVWLVCCPVLTPFLSGRPQMASYVLLLVMVGAAERLGSAVTAGDRGRMVRWIAALLLLEATWVNLHTAGLLGPAVAALAAGAQVAVPAGPARRRWPAALGTTVAVCALTAAAAALNPRGLLVVTDAVHVHAQTAGVISEWAPPPWTNPVVWLSVLVAVAAGVVAARSRRWPAVAVMVLLAVASLAAVRFMPMLSVLAVPELMAAASGPRVLGWARTRRGPLALAGALYLPVIAVSAVSALLSPARLDPVNFSVPAVRSLPAGCRALTDMGSGSLVVLLRWPAVKDSIDTRNELFGRAQIEQAYRLLDDKPGTRAELDRLGVTCVTAPSKLPLLAHLAHDARWRVTWHDRYATAVVRRTPLN